MNFISMFTKYNMNKFVDLILTHQGIFTIFTKVYLFGSCLNNKHPNDIDLLLVYDKYSMDVETQKIAFESRLYDILKRPIDITILSQQELEQTKFLEKIDHRYIKLIG